MLDTGNKIKDWLRKYLEYANLNTFVIGVSGGIDSAVTSTLCAMTGKPSGVKSCINSLSFTVRRFTIKPG